MTEALALLHPPITRIITDLKAQLSLMSDHHHVRLTLMVNKLCAVIGKTWENKMLNLNNFMFYQYCIIRCNCISKHLPLLTVEK